MKSELILTGHTILRGHKVIEVWHHGMLVATVAGADGPGVRVISKYPITAATEITPPAALNAMGVTVHIDRGPGPSPQ